MTSEPFKPRQALLDDADSARRRYAEAIRELQRAGVSFFDRAPELLPDLLAESRIYSNRAALLSSIPQRGMVGAIGDGVAPATREIVDALCPEALHCFFTKPRAASDASADDSPDPQVTVLLGDPLVRLQELPVETYDLVVLGIGLRYEEALRGLVAVESRVKPGGLVIVGDYAVWSPVLMSRCGVAKAVNEFANSRRWPLVGLALQSAGYYDVCLRKPA